MLYCLLIPFGEHTSMSTQMKSQQNTYPTFLLHADLLIGLLAVVAIMVGTTLLNIQTWEKESLDWIWQTASNMGVLLAVCIFALVINRSLGHRTSIAVRLAHFGLELCVIAGLVVSTLVIWNVTDTDVAWRAIGTIFILAIGSCLGIGISRMISR